MPQNTLTYEITTDERGTLHVRTFLEHTLLYLFALSKIDESLDERKTTDDFLSQHLKLFARLTLQKKTCRRSV